MSAQVYPGAFGAILDRLESGLPVSLITTFDLRTCRDDAEARSTLDDPALTDFDNLPVRDTAGRIIGVLERGESLHGPVKLCMRPLVAVPLVSSDTPILEYLEARGGAAYTLVVAATQGVGGIVTRSDLLKLPVRLLVFAHITHLEHTMLEAIRNVFASNPTDWKLHLKQTRLSKLEGEVERLRARHSNPDPLECTQFCDKRDILADARALPPEFTAELRDLEVLRNDVMHAASFVKRDDAVPHLVACIKNAARWISELGSGAA